jgi:hypothetical protein
MTATEYHGNIDPAITGREDGGMPPPAVPSARGLRGQAVQYPPSRRGTYTYDGGDRAPSGDERASIAPSLHSVAGTDMFSSQPEPQSKYSSTEYRVVLTCINWLYRHCTHRSPEPYAWNACARLIGRLLYGR